MELTDRNIEDWDFRGCFPGSSSYDAGADLFLSTHYTTVVAVDYLRLTVISTLLEHEIATLDDDRQHVRLPSHGDGILSGMKSADSRLTREGRLMRRVVQSMRREHRKYGKLRTTLLPDKADVAAGFAAFRDQTEAPES